MNGVIFISRCEHCQVWVEEALQRCPLCGNGLEGCLQAKAAHKATLRSYPLYDPKLPAAVAMKFFWLKIFPCILVGAFLLPSLLTMVTGKGNLIFNGETLGLAFSWVLVRYTLMSRMHLGKKFLLQIVNFSLALFIFDQITGHQGWSVNYAIPFLLVCATVIMMWVVYQRQGLWSDYAVYIMTLIFLGFMPCLLYLIRVASLFWPSAMAACCALLSLLAVSFFLDKKFRSYFSRRLHF